METLKFPYLKGTQMAHYEFSVFTDHVSALPLIKVMGLNARRLKATKTEPPMVKATLGATAVDAIKVDDLQDWLTKVGTVTDIARHFAGHFVGFLRGNSIELHALAALEKVKAKERSANYSILCEPFTSADFFRKDASQLGTKRLPPPVIDATAKAGSVDLFIRPTPSMWEPNGKQGIQHVSLDVNEAYHPNLLKDLHHANQEVMNGLEMVERYPTDPRVKRRMVPERQAVQHDGFGAHLVTIPAHPTLFPWERAIMESTADAQHIELPGSPYHRQRPLWIGL